MANIPSPFGTRTNLHALDGSGQIAIKFRSANALDQMISIVRGPQGDPGPPGAQGPPGDSVQSDPGDFTLIFENQLI